MLVGMYIGSSAEIMIYTRNVALLFDAELVPNNSGRSTIRVNRCMLF